MTSKYLVSYEYDVLCHDDTSSDNNSCTITHRGITEINITKGWDILNQIHTAIHESIQEEDDDVYNKNTHNGIGITLFKKIK